MKSIIKCTITIIIILGMVFTGCGSNENLDDEAGNNVDDTVQIPDDTVSDNESVPDTSKDEVQTVEAITFWEWRSNLTGHKAGEKFTFGEWRGKPVEWRVLDIQDDKVLVTSIELLGLSQYQDYSFDGEYGYGDYFYTTWAECSLRTWLNNDFYQTAFSEDEQQNLCLTLVKTPEINRVVKSYFDSNKTIEITPVYMQGSEDTEDMIFCLSVEEAETYFCWDEIRIANMIVTEQDYDYAVQTVEAIGLDSADWTYIWGGYELNEESPKMWWLRNGTYVNPYGGIWLNSISGDGDIPRGWPCGVRPAMWLQLDAAGVEVATN